MAARSWKFESSPGHQFIIDLSIKLAISVLIYVLTLLISLKVSLLKVDNLLSINTISSLNNVFVALISLRIFFKVATGHNFKWPWP